MALASRKELERYADDILVKTMKRTRYQFSVRDALADHLGQIIAELNRVADHADAREAISVKKATK